MFVYSEAFSRNIGWVRSDEQVTLRGKTVAIAGLGGVGGSHLLTLARLGIGGFHIADFDNFDIANFNRQAGATVSSLGRPKLEVLREMALDINPELRIKTFPRGVDAGNIGEFFSGADLYVDGLDFFAFAARRAAFARCAADAIPAITVAPLGMGAALLNFLPGRTSFEEYFRWEDHDEDELSLRFLIGLAPALLHRGYVVDPSRVDLKARRGPSTVMACQLCAGIAATEALKILLGRGRVLAAPWGMQFDAFRNKLSITWRPGGNRHPLQRLAMAYGRHKLRQMKAAAAT